MIEELKKIQGFDHLSHKSRVELENVKNASIIIVDGQPLAFKRDGRIIPVLIDTQVLEKMPRIVVDMGAVPHVVGGADIMAPGIRQVQGDFGEGQLVVVVDEKHGKFLAVGSSMFPAATLAVTKKGKVVRNLHYVGDAVWDVVKSHASPGVSPG